MTNKDIYRGPCSREICPMQQCSGSDKKNLDPETPKKDKRTMELRPFSGANHLYEPDFSSLTHSVIYLQDRFLICKNMNSDPQNCNATK